MFAITYRLCHLRYKSGVFVCSFHRNMEQLVATVHSPQFQQQGNVAAKASFLLCSAK